MSETETKPVIFLAFANDRDDTVGYLRNLPDEARRLRDVLERAEQDELCEVVVRSNCTAGDIFKVFQDPKFRNRIAIFHYGGHANGYQLLLESAEGQSAAAGAAGLAAFFSQQRGLQLVFLNGCSTHQQTEGLLNTNIAAVISTSRSIDDRVATDFSCHFYRGLSGGGTIESSFEEAEAAVQTVVAGNLRATYFGDADEKQLTPDRWPWELHFRHGREQAAQWNLPAAVNDPLFGLPPLPEQDLPESPYRHLNWYTRQDAEVFFGRGHQIRQLYDRLTTPRTPPVLLFYGQSGVGKSSMLDAGLIPRLQRDYQVVYRRHGDGGLVKALRSAFASAAASDPIDQLWHQAEQQAGNPAIVILDQIEEAYTRPSAESPDELQQLLEMIRTLFVDGDRRPKGKLVLGFRKEWLAELESQLSRSQIPRSKVFLERLDRQAVIDVVLGPTKNQRLRHRYGLSVEEGVAEIIADDLLEDHDSAVAPTLQILLTKLWARAKRVREDQPHISLDLYQSLKRDGILLRDFLNQQIDAFGKKYPEAVDSGLLLDLIALHTTPLGTANQCSQQQLREQYAHLGATLDDVLQQCQSLYLLTVSSENHDESGETTRLAHDTLAPLVRERFEVSDKPGQRARRILDNRSVDWSDGRNGTPLDQADLRIVENGRRGTRSLNETEQRLLQASRRQRIVRLSSIGAAAAIILLTVATAFFLVNQARKTALAEQAKAVDAKNAATQSVTELLELYLEIPRLAADVAAASAAEDAWNAYEKLLSKGIPGSRRVTSPDVANAIVQVGDHIQAWKDYRGDLDEENHQHPSWQRKHAVLRLVAATRDALEYDASGAGTLRSHAPVRLTLERDIVTAKLCQRATDVTQNIANAAEQGKGAIRQYREEFERLYWAELFWVEWEEKGRDFSGKSPLEMSMVTFRREGLQHWKLDDLSPSRLRKLAQTVRERCEALTSPPVQ